MRGDDGGDLDGVDGDVDDVDDGDMGEDDTCNDGSGDPMRSRRDARVAVSGALALRRTEVAAAALRTAVL